MKRIAAWISQIFRKELEILETLWAREFTRRDEQIAADFKKLEASFEKLEASFEAKVKSLESRLTAAIVGAVADARYHTINAHTDTQMELKDHASGLHTEARAAIGDVKSFIAKEMATTYAALVKDAAGAARLLEISKISQAICDDCHLPSRRFAASRVDGRIVCSACAAKGNK